MDFSAAFVFRDIVGNDNVHSFKVLSFELITGGENSKLRTQNSSLQDEWRVLLSLGHQVFGQQAGLNFKGFLIGALATHDRVLKL